MISNQAHKSSQPVTLILWSHLMSVQLNVPSPGGTLLPHLLLIPFPGPLQLGHLLLFFVQLTLHHGQQLLAPSEGLLVLLNFLPMV